MKLKISLLLFALTLSATVTFGQTEIIAHRGYWKTKGSAQNSITALVKADKAKCYGSEFDVWITADGKLVVNHDPTFKGVNLQYATYETEVKSLVLDNGESLPLLKDFLIRAKELDTKLILEIKAHKEKERTIECCNQAMALVKELGLEERMVYISFSYQAAKHIKQNAPQGTESYYLGGNVEPSKIKADGLDGIDYNGNILKDKHPEWIKECHDLGLKVNVWTIDDKETLQYFIDQNVDYITTNEPVVLKKMLRKNKK